MFLLGLLSIFFTSAKVWSQECPEGFIRISAHERDSYHKADGTKVSAALVESHCRSERKLSKPKPQFKTLKPEGWPEKQETFKAWLLKEKLDVERALKKLPRKLTHFGEIQFFRSRLPSENPAVSNSKNQIIVIYDSVSSHALDRVIAHELAHFYWDSLSEKIKKDFLTAAEWKINSDLSTLSLVRKNITINDSYLGPHEDFANNVELFISNPQELRKSPQLFNCLEKILK